MSCEHHHKKLNQTITTTAKDTNKIKQSNKSCIIYSHCMARPYKSTSDIFVLYIFTIIHIFSHAISISLEGSQHTKAGFVNLNQGSKTQIIRESSLVVFSIGCSQTVPTMSFCNHEF